MEKLPNATRDSVPKLPIHIDSTMLTTFRSCPQKFFYEFCHGLRPTSSSIHLHAGGAFAATVEAVRQAYYNHQLSPEEALCEGFRTFSTYWGDYPDSLDEVKSVVNVWKGICSFFENWPLDDDHIKPYMSAATGEGTFEYSFAIPLPIDHPSGVPFIFCGRIDLLGEYLGKPCAVDEKTASQLGATFAEKWRMRGQFLGYCWALRQAGIPVDTAVVRATAFYKTKIDHLEVIQPYSAKLIDKWYEELLRSLADILRYWEAQAFPLNFGDSCSAYSNCPMQLLCTAPRQDSDWFPDYKVKHWNPLLRNPLDTRVEELKVADLIKPTFEDF